MRRRCTLGDRSGPQSLEMMLLLALLVCLCSLHSPPLVVSAVMTPAPSFDQSARLPPLLSAAGGSFLARGNWNPSSRVWFPGSTAELDGVRDLDPEVELQIEIWSGYSAWTPHVSLRFESLLGAPVRLSWTTWVDGAHSVIVAAGAVSPPFIVSSWGPQDLRATLWDQTTGGWSLRANDTALWISVSPFEFQAPTPLSDADWHLDWITLQISLAQPPPPSPHAPPNQRSMQLTRQPRSEAFQIVLADRRQHFQGTALSPARPLSDLMILECRGDGQFNVGYGCRLPRVMFDPDRVVNGSAADAAAAASASASVSGPVSPAAAAASPLGEAPSLANLLAQFYIYELRRFDTWRYLSPSTARPPFDYVSLYSVASAAPELPRLPLQFLPLFGTTLYEPCPFEAVHSPAAATEQAVTDVCDPAQTLASMGLSCRSMFLHSGLRVLGLWSTVPGDLYLCSFSGSGSTAAQANAIVASSLGTVDASGSSIVCPLTAAVWTAFPAGWTLALTVFYLPLNRAHFSANEEAQVASEMAEAKRHAEHVAQGDRDNFFDAPVVLPLEHRQPGGSAASSSILASMGSVVAAAAATFSAAFSSASAPRSLPLKTLPRQRLSAAQRHHPHWRTIEQLLDSPLVADAAAAPASVPPSRRRLHQRVAPSSLSSSVSNPWDSMSAASSNASVLPNPVQVLAERVVPLGGYSLSANPSAKAPLWIVASQDTPTLPDLLAAREQRFVFFVTQATPIATVAVLALAFALIAGCALWTRFEHKCPALRRLMQQQPRRRRSPLPAPVRVAEGVAERLIDDDDAAADGGGRAARSAPGAVAPLSDAAASDASDASSWTFDFAHERAIDMHVARSLTREQSFLASASHQARSRSASISDSSYVEHSPSSPVSCESAAVTFPSAPYKAAGEMKASSGARGASLLHGSSVASSSSSFDSPATAVSSMSGSARTSTASSAACPSDSALMPPSESFALPYSALH